MIEQDESLTERRAATTLWSGTGWRFQMRVIAAAALCAGGLWAGAGEAATFYYISGVYNFSNYTFYDPSKFTIPTFTVGSLTVDESKLPDGQSLAGSKIYGINYDPEIESSWPDGVKLRFANQLDIYLYGNQDFGWGDQSWVEFGDDAMPKNWHFRSYAPNDTSWISEGLNGIGRDYDIDAFGGDIWAETQEEYDAILDQRITDFLEDRGYKKGNAAYNEVRAKYTWVDGYSSPAGESRWFDDPFEFAAAIEAATRQAVITPPLNVYDIPDNPAPVPLPAAGWLLIGGAAALGALKARRRGQAA